jgi:uncharacterized protein YqhQ
MGKSDQCRYDPSKPMQIGGQAVLEGVMMRAPGMVATAVRRSDGTVVIRKEPHRPLADRFPILKLPVLRGAIGLVEMLVIGIRTLNFSAEVAMQTPGGGNGTSLKETGLKEKLALGVTLLVALVAGAALFFATPLVVATLLFSVEQDPLGFNLVAGAIRIAIFLAYLLAISRMKDIGRLFQYHGAEHKAVFAFEKGLELTVEESKRQSRFHPRCGTSFLLVVMLVAIALFAMLDALLISLFGEITLLTRLIAHLPLIPVVGGVSYEFIKLSAKKSETSLGRMIVAPGLWLQRITTNEPDGDQLQIALTALRAALGQDAFSEVASPREYEVAVN